jgi:acyl-CoA dehydrogenase
MVRGFSAIYPGVPGGAGRWRPAAAAAVRVVGGGRIIHGGARHGETQPRPWPAVAEGVGMDFALSPEQEAIREGVSGVCARFDDAYWLQRDREGGFPHDFHRAMAEAGWLGICIPEEYGGSGLGITEATIMMEAIAASGAGMSGATAVHLNIFGLNPVVVFGTAEQKARMLPPIASGAVKACFGVTEPTTGLDTTRLKTRAERRGDRYVVNGQKVWISTAQVADTILLLARTTPIEQCRSPADGISLFYTRLDRSRASVREIEKMGRKAVDSNEVFFEDFEVPVEDRIGEEGQGFRQILHGLNPERVLIAAEAVGIGRAALRRAADYARERVVFGRPIGQNQSVQHPLAQDWMALEAAWLMCLNAAWRYDRGLECGAQANAAKYLSAEAGMKACQNAVMTHGGFGYAKEYHVERFLREAMIPWIAPVSPNLVCCYIAERVLGLPKSY